MPWATVMLVSLSGATVAEMRSALVSFAFELFNVFHSFDLLCACPVCKT